MELLHEIPGNPVPERTSADHFTTFDGKRLRYALVKAVGRPLKGTVVLMQGRNECLEKYFETASDLSKRGFGVAMFDWRGQGGSDRLTRNQQRGHVRSFFDYTRDLDTFFEEVVLPDCRGPYYVLAHSAGALIALLGAPSMVNRVRRMVLIAPFLAYKGYPVSMTTARRLTSALYYLGLGWMYAAWGARPKGGTPFAENKLTSDPVRYARNIQFGDTFAPLSLGGPTVAWIRAACQAAEIVQDPAFMTRIKVPVMFIGAGADEVVSTKLVADYARKLRGGAMLTIDGARHEILQEADLYREQFFAAFDAFIPGTDEVLETGPQAA